MNLPPPAHDFSTDSSQIISAQQLAWVDASTQMGVQEAKEAKFAPYVAVQVFAPGTLISNAPKSKTKTIK